VAEKRAIIKIQTLYLDEYSVSIITGFIIARFSAAPVIFDIHDVSGISSLPMFRRLVVTILTFFCFKITRDGWDRTRYVLNLRIVC
jgi:hypothetical protein